MLFSPTEFRSLLDLFLNMSALIHVHNLMRSSKPTNKTAANKTRGGWEKCQPKMHAIQMHTVSVYIIQLHRMNLLAPSSLSVGRRQPPQRQCCGINMCIVCVRAFTRKQRDRRFLCNKPAPGHTARTHTPYAHVAHKFVPRNTHA